MSLCVGRYIYFSMERSSHFDAQIMSTASAGEGGSSDAIEGPVKPSHKKTNRPEVFDVAGICPKMNAVYKK